MEACCSLRAGGEQSSRVYVHYPLLAGCQMGPRRQPQNYRRSRRLGSGECAVGDMGGQIAAMDTDSARIVSTNKGGLVPCVGGPHRRKTYNVPNGYSAVRALSEAEVERLRDRFETLNPWRETLKVPFLKLEKENYGLDGQRKQLHAFCIPQSCTAFLILTETSPRSESLPVMTWGFCKLPIVSLTGN